jgi:hypothetical protein
MTQAAPPDKLSPMPSRSLLSTPSPQSPARGRVVRPRGASDRRCGAGRGEHAITSWELIAASWEGRGGRLLIVCNICLDRRRNLALSRLPGGRISSPVTLSGSQTASLDVEARPLQSGFQTFPHIMVERESEPSRLTSSVPASSHARHLAPHDTLMPSCRRAKRHRRISSSFKRYLCYAKARRVQRRLKAPPRFVNDHHYKRHGGHGMSTGTMSLIASWLK